MRKTRSKILPKGAVISGHPYPYRLHYAERLGAHILGSFRRPVEQMEGVER